MTQGFRTGDSTSSPASHGTCDKEPSPLLQTSMRASAGIRTGNTHIAIATGNTHIAMATGNTHIAMTTGSTHIAMTTHCKLDTVPGQICCSDTFWLHLDSVTATEQFQTRTVYSQSIYLCAICIPIENLQSKYTYYV